MSNDIIVNQLCAELECKPEELVSSVKAMKAQILRTEDIMARRDLKIAERELQQPPGLGQIKERVQGALKEINKVGNTVGMLSGRFNRMSGK